MTAQIEMPRYLCHKQVHALQIATVIWNATTTVGTLTFVNPSYAPTTVSGYFMRKYSPRDGGYYVRYEDGSVSFSPADAFESGYTPV